MAEDSADRLPDRYRRAGRDAMARPDGPYPQLVWLWVYYQGGWSTTGSGVLIDDDVILTCAHIFAFNGAPYDRVVRVSAFPGYNQPLESDQEPAGGRYVETVFICGKAFQDVQRQGDVDSAWDLAVVCLGSAVPARGTPPFVVSAESHLDQDPAFQGPDSQLMTAGYGGPGGVIVEATMPIAEAFEGRHWMGVDLTPSPGQSGAPMFHPGKSSSGGPEYRLVGVVSAEDRHVRNRTIGAMITGRTAGWIASAQETHRKVKELKKPGQQPDRLLVRLHFPDRRPG